MDVYLETGWKRSFACALEWPGYCRSGKTDDEALEALARYGDRYLAAVSPESGFSPPRSAGGLVVREHRKGGSGTDFGIPSGEAKADARPVDASELSRLRSLLTASWAAFDAIAEGATGRELRTGPRGGGRNLDKIVDHVLGAEEAYVKGIGCSTADIRVAVAGSPDRLTAVRALALETMADRARGVALPENPRRKAKIWSVRYFARRSAWHALDHAWEIEDRVL
ncbi:MAG TPA: hypothetical protein VJ839_06670 [Candidatus Limnocylindria bacterium]|nr:hypothetical protein [Candidatus Limnocylindria bacterium]